MPRNVYSEEFKRDAVAMYENLSDSSLKHVSKDLGVSRCALGNWVATSGTGKKSKARHQAQQARALTDAEQIRQLQKELAIVKEEREILRNKAHYCATQMHPGSVSRSPATCSPSIRSSGCARCRKCAVRPSTSGRTPGQHVRKSVRRDMMLGAVIQIIVDATHGLYAVTRISA